MKKYRIVKTLTRSGSECFSVQRRRFFFFWEEVEYSFNLDVAQVYLESIKKVDSYKDRTIHIE